MVWKVLLLVLPELADREHRVEHVCSKVPLLHLWKGDPRQTVFTTVTGWTGGGVV